MSRGYVAVPPEAIRETLQKAGFALLPPSTSGAEEVYERAHHKNPGLRIRVYSTIAYAFNANGDGKYIPRTRDRGQDAIRVTVVLVGIVKGAPGQVIRGVAGGKAGGNRRLARIHRTGSEEAVLGRLLARMREAYTMANEEAVRIREHAVAERRRREAARPELRPIEVDSEADDLDDERAADEMGERPFNDRWNDYGGGS